MRHIFASNGFVLSGEGYRKVSKYFILVHFGEGNRKVYYFGEEIVNGKIKANELFSGPEAKYTMSDLEIEKFKIEAEQRKLKSEGNQPKFGDTSYTAPGGSDYTELVFKIKKGGISSSTSCLCLNKFSSKIDTIALAGRFS